jgi:glycosyltransferase involved in cell wall biosynthesis
MIAMKKVLIVSYFFTRKEEIGALRINGLTKFLPSFGWESTILTSDSGPKKEMIPGIVQIKNIDAYSKWKRRFGVPNGSPFRERRVTGDDTRGKRISDRMFAFLEEAITYPDAYVDWFKSAIPVGERLLDNGGFDAIISSSFPYTSHLIAGELRKDHELPWIADFRDLWTLNPYYPHSSLRRMMDRRLELRTVRSADALTTVSIPLADSLMEFHCRRDVHVIPNGYDPDDVNTGVPLKPGFHITHTGQLYLGKRSPEPLFQALRELISEGAIDRKLLSIDFYGKPEDWLSQKAKEYDLVDIVRLHGEVSHQDALMVQRQSQVLLLLTWIDSRKKGVYTGKVFEYLAARRPVLAIGHPDSIVKELIQRTNSGFYASAVPEIKSVLRDLYRQYVTNGNATYQGTWSEIEMFNQVTMAKRFALLLDELSESG